LHDRKVKYFYKLLNICFCLYLSRDFIQEENYLTYVYLTDVFFLVESTREKKSLHKKYSGKKSSA